MNTTVKLVRSKEGFSYARVRDNRPLFGGMVFADARAARLYLADANRKSAVTRWVEEAEGTMAIPGTEQLKLDF